MAAMEPEEKKAEVLAGPLGPTLMKVVKGTPTPEELAAVAAVLSAASSPADERPEDSAQSRRAPWRRIDSRDTTAGSWMA
ncbi:acyl-CoA carboxylase epsilon subunit [Streptomyces sp. NPDC050504]|uniref:acyl-CoA carboxylase epsilon subunit n=1 Tax=Streptomyces sp. NPDC050504 TaxID=3365618 RepID=UPI0037B95941